MNTCTKIKQNKTKQNKINLLLVGTESTREIGQLDRKVDSNQWQSPFYKIKSIGIFINLAMRSLHCKCMPRIRRIGYVKSTHDELVCAVWHMCLLECANH